MDNNSLVVPLEAFDQFIDSLEAKEIVEIIKTDPAFADKVFQGFRHNAQAIKAPVVRQRLVRAYELDSEFREILLEYWTFHYTPLRDFVAEMSLEDLKNVLLDFAQKVGGLNLYLALTFDSRKGVRKLAEKRRNELLNPDVAASPEPVDSNQSSEPECGRNDKLSRELKAAKERIAALQKENRSLEQKVKSLEKDLQKLEKTAIKLKRTIEEQDRDRLHDLRRLELAEKGLERSHTVIEEQEARIKELRKALDKKPDTNIDLPAAPWQDAVDDLLKARKYQQALDFLVFLLPHAQEDPRVHELLNRTYKALGDIKNRRNELLWLGDYYLSRGSLGAAADRLCRVLIIDRDSNGAKSRLMSLFKRVDLKNERRVSEIRRVISRFQPAHPETCRKIFDLAKTVSPALAKTLEGSSTGIQIDRMVKLDCKGIALHISPRQIVEAINKNDVDTVTSVKEALRALQLKHPSSYQAMDQGIRDCDPSCCVTIAGGTQPVIVDASNVAHNLASSNGKPRLKNITLIRQELRSRGYFPIYIIADAALPHQIDQHMELIKLVETGEIELADPHTDADEQIIERARTLKCPIITRDRMLDWDPKNEVQKIRYGLDQDEAEVFDLDW